MIVTRVSNTKIKVLCEARFGAGQNTIAEVIKADQVHAVIHPYFEGGAFEPAEKKSKRTKIIIN